MNTIPEPENYSQKEVYAFFGLAAYSAQVIEKGLVNMVITFKTFGLPITRADFDVIFDSHDSRTFGQLLRTARDQHIPIPHDTGKLLTQALKKRNYLNHDFFADHPLYAARGIKRMFVDEAIKVFQSRRFQFECFY